MKRILQITGIIYAVTLLSCDPGARYFRMRKSRNEATPFIKPEAVNVSPTSN